MKKLDIAGADMMDFPDPYGFGMVFLKVKLYLLRLHGFKFDVLSFNGYEKNDES